MRQQANKTNKCNKTKLKLWYHVRTRPLPTKKEHQEQAQEDICDRLSWATNPQIVTLRLNISYEGSALT